MENEDGSSSWYFMSHAGSGRLCTLQANSYPANRHAIDVELVAGRSHDARDNTTPTTVATIRLEMN